MSETPEDTVPKQPLFAWSREGLKEVSVNLTEIADTNFTSGGDSSPLPFGAPGDVLDAAAGILGPAVLPDEGLGPRAALRKLASVLIEYGIDLTHPLIAAHLQPPSLAVAVAADALASASNASLDTFDSGPSSIVIERWLINVLIDMARLGERADGVMTPGGSLSNFLGLLLARDATAMRRGVNVREDGVAALAGPVVFCSEFAHFSIHRACAALGLGEAAVHPLPTDSQRRIRPESLLAALDRMNPDQTPLAVIATAGTTDFGSVDPLPQIAEIAGERGIWMHVDAAYGFGALFSDRLRAKLAGLEMADSITLDLHKLGWQPASSSVLLVSDTLAFTALDRQVAYLNPTDDSEAGYDGLLGRSLQTTRRPDAIKAAATLMAYGRNGIGRMVDNCHELARHAEQRIRNDPELELVSPAELTTVLFRYRTADPAAADAVNGALRRRLLENGQALIGRTSAKLNGPGAPESVCLKLTMLNPTADVDDVDTLVQAVLEAGRACLCQFEEVAT